VDYEPEKRALQEVNKPALSDVIVCYQFIYLTCVCAYISLSSQGAEMGLERISIRSERWLQA